MLLVIGASGFLGSALASVAVASGRAVTGTFNRHCLEHRGMKVVRADLKNLAAVRELIAGVRPTAVVNCAAFTNVDGCEADPDHARLLNVELPAMVARSCEESGIELAHISTDSVFDGVRGGYTEEDSTAPLNVYAQTKLDGERAVLGEMPNSLVIRTNFIGHSPSGRAGLADWLRASYEAGQRISGFTDVVFAPLFTAELAGILLEMLDLKLRGIYHVAAKDSVSKYEFALRLGTALGADTSLVDATSLASARLVARRPLNTSLLPLRVETALGRRMASVDSAIAGYAARFHTPVEA